MTPVQRQGRGRSEASEEGGAGLPASETPTKVGGRVLLAVLPLVALLLIVRATGLVEHLDVDGLRARLQANGAAALPIFVLVYGLGIVAHVPGSIFVGAAVLAFGPWVGGAASYVGALAANLLSFGLVRLTGYRPFETLDWPVLQRLLRGLDRYPTWSVTVVRVVFPTTAPVSYVLALSGVRTRAYVVGSMIGVLPQLAATVAVFGAMF